MLLGCGRYALVLPVDSHKSQLKVQREGLDLLASIDGPIAPVVVIGPYRSGKSFTLNQLLGLNCSKSRPRGAPRGWEAGLEQQLAQRGARASLPYVSRPVPQHAPVHNRCTP